MVELRDVQFGDQDENPYPLLVLGFLVSERLGVQLFAVALQGFSDVLVVLAESVVLEDRVDRSRPHAFFAGAQEQQDEGLEVVSPVLLQVLGVEVQEGFFQDWVSGAYSCRHRC